MPGGEYGYPFFALLFFGEDDREIPAFFLGDSEVITRMGSLAFSREGHGFPSPDDLTIR